MIICRGKELDVSRSWLSFFVIVFGGVFYIMVVWINYFFFEKCLDEESWISRRFICLCIFCGSMIVERVF